MKEIKMEYRGKTLSIYPEGELDHHTVRDIRLACDPEIARLSPEVIELDFSGVSFMDSSGIGLILGRKNAADSIGAKVVLSGLCPRLLRIVTLSGVLRLEGISLADKGGSGK